MMRRLLIAFSLVFALANSGLAAPVTGWVVVNPSTGGPTTKPLSDANTNSPVLGNGAEDSAATVAMYADINGTLNNAPDFSLANGETITLSGSATLEGIASAIEQFRWGLFNDATPAPFDASGWVGFIASNSAGSGGGALRAKPSETGTFAQTGSATNLKSAQDGDEFLDETYSFSMSVSRYNDELSIDASLTSGDDWTQVWNDVAVVPPKPMTFNFNRVGFLAGGGMHANRILFNDIDVSTASISALTLQVTTAGPHAGMMQIRNEQSVDFEIEYYEILSSGSLDVDDWTSLDEQEDGDPDLEGWEEAAGNGSTLLSEYQLFTTTTVAAQSSLSLGRAFTAGGDQDLKFYVGLADGTLVRGIVEYVDSPELAGDYTNDGTVDAADYVMWRKLEGANSLLPNDPHGGPIGVPQYAEWLKNFGQTTSGMGGGNAAAVPEPLSVLTVAIAIVACVAGRQSRLRHYGSMIAETRPHVRESLRDSHG